MATNDKFESNDLKTTFSSLLDNFLTDNKIFMETHDSTYFDAFKDGQKPRATIVMCSDSRVQSNDFDFTADNDLFTIRNIGNLFINNKGSIEYGVLHLNTPILIFIGHSSCGAVKAMYEGHYGNLEPNIQNELFDLNNEISGYKPLGISFNDAIIKNTEKQVEKAYNHFLNSGKKLLICSAFYDFTNILGNGLGKLNFLNTTKIIL